MAARDAEFSESMAPGMEGSVTFVRPCPGELCELGGGVPPDVPPVVTLISPPAGSVIQPTDTVIVQVTDDIAIELIVLVVKFAADNSWECAWDGTAWAGQYTGSSTSTIPGGTEFRVVRAAGWRSSPTIEVLAIDSGGHPAT